MKIISVIKLPKRLMDLLQGKGEVIIKDRLSLSEEDVKDAEIIIGNIKRSLLVKCESLKYYQLDSAGSDTYANVVKEDCVLCNASGTFGASIAEHLVMTTLMLFRNMPYYIENQRQHVYNPKSYVKMIKNSRFLIFGTGDLGSEYAKAIKSLGGYTIGVKRTPCAQIPYFDEVYINEEIDSILSSVDVVCLCLPKNNLSDHIMNEARLNQLKSDAIVLNVGRGNAIDQKYLCKRLNEGKLLGAALDVFEKEPISSDDPIWETKNLIITPHVSGTYANEWTYSLFYDILEKNLNCYFSRKPLHNVVDRKLGY